jgi:hypothetical protein
MFPVAIFVCPLFRFAGRFPTKTQLSTISLMLSSSFRKFLKNLFSSAKLGFVFIPLYYTRPASLVKCSGGLYSFFPPSKKPLDKMSEVAGKMLVGSEKGWEACGTSLLGTTQKWDITNPKLAV